jgi:hypothetical protein
VGGEIYAVSGYKKEGGNEEIDYHMFLPIRSSNFKRYLANGRAMKTTTRTVSSIALIFLQRYEYFFTWQTKRLNLK